MLSETTSIYNGRCPLRRTLILLGACVSIIGPAASKADSIRPAYLEIVETGSGAIEVVWKLPKIPGLPPTLAPSLPSAFVTTSDLASMDTPDASVQKWSMTGPSLSGQTVGIVDLETFTMEALLRVELADGTTIRTVLKPSSPRMTVPVATKDARPANHPWVYPAMVVAAFALSHTKPARRRGVFLCSLALVIGSLAGDGIGRRLPGNGPVLEEAEAKRLLQGLMLNTYRAFIFEDDGLVYDILSRSVSGSALNEVFLENRSSLSFNDPESASSLVNRLDIKTIDSMTENRDGSITLLTDWDVYGSVFHWEHVHFRCNAFKAEITIVPSDGYWKITELNILEEERVL